MKKFVLLLVSLFVFVSVPTVSAQEITESENETLVILNQSLYQHYFFNFNPETKTFNFVPNELITEQMNKMLAGETSEEETQTVNELKDVFYELYQAIVEKHGPGYTFKMLSGTDVSHVLIELKDDDVITDVFEEIGGAVDSGAAEVPEEFQVALDTAETSLDALAFSKEGLYNQLLYKEFSEEAAQYAVDNIQADWNEQAVLVAQRYLDIKP